MTKLKKTMAALLAAVCLTTASAFAAPAPAFADVPAGSECASAVAYVTEKGLMQGYGNGVFGVNDFVTYAQLDMVLRRYQGQEAHWTDEASPTAPITRGQLALPVSAPTEKKGKTLVAYFSMPDNVDDSTVTINERFWVTTNTWPRSSRRPPGPIFSASRR